MEVSRGPLQTPMDEKCRIYWLSLNPNMKVQARIFVPVIPTKKNFNTLSTSYKGAVFNNFPQTIITMFRPTIKFEFPFIKG